MGYNFRYPSIVSWYVIKFIEMHLTSYQIYSLAIKFRHRTQVTQLRNLTHDTLLDPSVGWGNGRFLLILHLPRRLRDFGQVLSAPRLADPNNWIEIMAPMARWCTDVPVIVLNCSPTTERYATGSNHTYASMKSKRSLFLRSNAAGQSTFTGYKRRIPLPRHMSLPGAGDPSKIQPAIVWYTSQVSPKSAGNFVSYSVNLFTNRLDRQTSVRPSQRQPDCRHQWRKYYNVMTIFITFARWLHRRSRNRS